MADLKADDIRRDVKKDPDNWEEMKQKYLEREQEATAKLMASRKMASRNVNTVEEMINVEKEELDLKKEKRAEDFKPLTDRKILVDPSDDKVKEKVKEIKLELFAKPGGEHKPDDLRGRVTHPKKGS